MVLLLKLPPTPLYHYLTPQKSVFLSLIVGSIVHLLPFMRFILFFTIYNIYNLYLFLFSCFAIMISKSYIIKRRIISKIFSVNTIISIHFFPLLRFIPQ